MLFTEDTFPCHMKGVGVTFTWDSGKEILWQVPFKDECQPDVIEVFPQDEKAVLIWCFYEEPLPVHSEEYAMKIQAAILNDYLGVVEALKKHKVRDVRCLSPKDQFKVHKSSLELGSALELEQLESVLVEACESFSFNQYRSALSLAEKVEMSYAEVANNRHYHRDGLVLFRGSRCFIPWHDMINKETLILRDRGYLSWVAAGTAYSHARKNYWVELEDKWVALDAKSFDMHIKYNLGLTTQRAADLVRAYAQTYNRVEIVGEFLWSSTGIREIAGEAVLNTAALSPCSPAPEYQSFSSDWHVMGREVFPNIYKLLEGALRGGSGVRQVERFVSILRRQYKAALSGAGVPREAIVLAGGGCDAEHTMIALADRVCGDLLDANLISVQRAVHSYEDSSSARRIVSQLLRETISRENLGGCGFLYLKFEMSSDDLTPGAKESELSRLHLCHIDSCEGVEFDSLKAELPFLARYLLDTSDDPADEGLAIRHPKLTQRSKGKTTEHGMEALEVFLAAHADRHPGKIWWQGTVAALRREMSVLNPELVSEVFGESGGRTLSSLLRKFVKANMNVISFSSFKSTKGALVWRIGYDLNKAPNHYFKKVDAVNSSVLQSRWLKKRSAGELSDKEIFGESKGRESSKRNKGDY